MKDTLWYDSPSDVWQEGLPIGNGRLAAMVCQTETADILHLNHEWIWRGVNRSRDNINAAYMLEPVRDLLKKNDFFRATLLSNAFFGGEGGVSGLPCRNDAYQPAGTVEFESDIKTCFKKRSLDITNGVAYAERETERGKLNSYFIAHSVLNNVVCRWDGDVSGTLLYSRVEDTDANEELSVTDGKIIYKCKFNGGITFATEVTYLTDGNECKLKNGVKVTNASYLTVFINIATDIAGIDEELKNYTPDLSIDWVEVLRLHTESFANAINSFSFNYECKNCDDPTDKRIANVKRGGCDDELPLLYYNYGRYLLASSSLCGSLPANLQGKWNDSIEPPWESDYHFDINLQMNYWLAEPTGMQKCVEPLLKYCERFVPHAKKAAMDLYGCRGIYIPLSSDAWGIATPEQLGWGVWIGAAPWLAQHFWWHYIYSMDEEFLRERAYPFFKEIAFFYEDYLVCDENGVMQIMPSQSPENTFDGTGSVFEVSIGVSSAMDVQLAYDLLGYAIKSAEILNIDESEVKIWKRLRDNLPEFKIGSDGRLLEWDREMVEKQPGHRHLSHLYGVYPSDIFTENRNRKQYEAAQQSFDFRLSQGGGYTGWSRAWAACLCARFARGDEAYKHIFEMIKEFSTITLLDLHPPKIFQIDGNLGSVAAITECIAQFTDGSLKLLYAVPKKMNNGSVKHLRVPGGHILSFSWRNGKFETGEVQIGKSGKIEIFCDSRNICIEGNFGEVKKIEI